MLGGASSARAGLQSTAASTRVSHNRRFMLDTLSRKRRGKTGRRFGGGGGGRSDAPQESGASHLGRISLAARPVRGKVWAACRPTRQEAPMAQPHTVSPEVQRALERLRRVSGALPEAVETT